MPTLLASRPRRRTRSERGLRHLATSRESRRMSMPKSKTKSLRYILASPGYAPGTIAVNVTWKERGFNACQTHRSMYPSIFNRFPVIQPESPKVRHFSTFFAHFGLPRYAPGTVAVNVTWIEREFNADQTPRSIYPSIFNHFWNIAIYRWRVIDFQQSREVNERFYYILLSPGYAPGTIAINVTRLERGFNACQTPRSLHISIYLQPFLRYSKLLVENCDIFMPYICLVGLAPQGVTPSEFREDLDTHKTRMNLLSCAEESMTICLAVLIQYQRVTDGQTVRQTVERPAYS